MPSFASLLIFKCCALSCCFNNSNESMNELLTFKDRSLSLFDIIGTRSRRCGCGIVSRLNILSIPVNDKPLHVNLCGVFDQICRQNDIARMNHFHLIKSGYSEICIVQILVHCQSYWCPILAVLLNVTIFSLVHYSFHNAMFAASSVF
eukprot:328090_1